MTVFVIAMANEADCVLRHLTDASEETLSGRRTVRGKLRDRAVAVVVSGIGKTNAAAATQLAISEFHPDEIVNVGLCGGFDPALRVGDICPVKRAVEYDFDLAQLNGTDVGVLNERTSPYIPFACAGDGRTLGTGDHFRDGDGEAALFARLGITLRDMEGAAIAHVCETAGIPCRAWKAVSNVQGRGSMTGQYQANAVYALDRLAEAVPALPVTCGAR